MANIKMDQDEGMDNIIDLTDTSDSDSYQDRVFLAQHTPLVLELHDIRKDDPLPTDATPPQPPTAGKLRKQKKKKKDTANKNASYSSLSSENLSDASSVAPPPETKEKFYDARESYHGIPPNQVPLTAAAAVLQTHSVTPSITHSIEAAQDPKTTAPASSQQQTTTSAPTEERKEPSPISKPTLPRE
ncbi:uncharacterized protein LOC111349623 isoform X1 [Spodoptera litura]|uniref:Uncharacterized protein LOC111349623 isoform X1 n=1 Tax=Spodoptera litura TaxID=69820 RepID=A0A9J7DTU9_SPOLT|nr:uncharacterized protein LOC111349623 isoform X1 [Spodoptera litura]